MTSAVILTAVVCVLAGWLLGRSLMSPFRVITARAKEILNAGNTAVRIPLTSDASDVQELVSVINEMLERNDQLTHQLRTAFDNVAHDLRTPVTRLRAAAEVALQGPGDVTVCKEALADCLEESERVLQILNCLMDVAEAETGSMRLRKKEVSIAALVQDVIDMYREVAEEKSIRVTSSVSPSLVCEADEVRVRQALGNLLDNAIKYNRENGWVAFQGEMLGSEAVISVSDGGIGVPENECERLWERLYRSERSRTEKGMGLGLSFVKAIMEAHGGRTWVTSVMNEGSAFHISLPMRQDLRA